MNFLRMDLSFWEWFKIMAGWTCRIFRWFYSFVFCFYFAYLIFSVTGMEIDESRWNIVWLMVKCFAFIVALRIAEACLLERDKWFPQTPSSPSENSTD